jgi:hypothetical protein
VIDFLKVGEKDKKYYLVPLILSHSDEKKIRYKIDTKLLRKVELIS